MIFRRQETMPRPVIHKKKCRIIKKVKSDGTIIKEMENCSREEMKALLSLQDTD